MPKPGSKDVDSSRAALSRRETGLLAQWERERRRIVTLDEIRSQVGEGSTSKVAGALVRKGLLQRVGRGAYLVRPFRTLGRASTPSSAVAVEAFLGNQPHYLGGLWALSLHRLSEQRYESVLDAFVTHRIAARRLGAAQVRFHVLAPHLFTYGIATSTLEGVDVQVSDLHRTLLDALDHPRVFLGIARGVDLVKANLAKVDPKRLLSYAVAGSKPSTCQRLGVLLERAGASRSMLAPLRRRARESGSLLSMDPEAARAGRVNPAWNVVENDA